jgi:hypothetical protein
MLVLKMSSFSGGSTRRWSSRRTRSPRNILWSMHYCHIGNCWCTVVAFDWSCLKLSEIIMKFLKFSMERAKVCIWHGICPIVEITEIKDLRKFGGLLNLVKSSYRWLAVTSSSDVKQWRHRRTSAILEVFFSRCAGRFNWNNVRKRPKIGYLTGPIETFQCI